MIPQRPFVAVLLALAAACTPGVPGSDDFQMQAVGLENVTAVLEQRWNANVSSASVRHETQTEAGRARLLIRDADARLVYDAPLLPNLEAPVVRGAPGAWRVQVILTDFTGALDFTLDPVGDAGIGRWLRGLPLFAIVFALFLAVMVIAYRRIVVEPRHAGAEDERSIGFTRELVMLGITAAGALIVIVAALYAVPIGESTRSAVIGLLGLVITAILTLSSTTLVSNAIAGFMLRAVRPFRRGDWLRVGDQFGRVTERGVVQTQLQTEDRDYATLPNLELITKPITVIRRSGTYVAATVSLGYDLHHARIEELLERAALESGLKEPIEVRVLDLGNFSVTYRVAGRLVEDIKLLLVAESNLRRCILDVLHGEGIEIVSPAFMNQRRIEQGAHFVPEGGAVFPAPTPAQAVDVIFDEAQEATLEEAREEVETLERAVAEAEEKKAEAPPDERARLEAEIEELRGRHHELLGAIEKSPEPPDG